MIGFTLPVFRLTILKCQIQLIQRSCVFAKRFIRQLLVGLFLINLGLGTAYAQAWNTLSEDQRSVLAPLEEDWGSLSLSRQKKWVEVANFYPKMEEADRITLQSRMSAWAGLSTKERQRARDNYLRTLKISPEKKAAAWENYQQLTDEEKKLLADKRAASAKRTTVTSPALK
jgi:hypothetical protein